MNFESFILFFQRLERIRPRHAIADAAASDNRPTPRVLHVLVHQMAMITLDVINENVRPARLYDGSLQPSDLVSCNDVRSVSNEIVVRQSHGDSVSVFLTPGLPPTILTYRHSTVTTKNMRRACTESTGWHLRDNRICASKFSHQEEGSSAAIRNCPRRSASHSETDSLCFQRGRSHSAV